MLVQCTLLLVMRDVQKVSLLYMLVQCTLLLVMRDVQKVSLLYTLIQCTPLLVMRDVWKVSLLVHTYTVYTPIGDEGCLEGEPAVYTLVHGVHPYW